MNYNYQSGQVSSPTANISVNRNRLKQYGETVYLKSGTHFEIELFNTKPNKVLARIYLDGNSISDSGIVLNPGQRIYLERWIDQPKKFLFETYEVENSAEAKNAISQNGRIKVEFYDQAIFTGNVGYVTNPTWTYNPLSGPVYGGTTENQIYFSSNVSSDVIGQKTSIVPTSLFGPSSIETGRAEKGEPSDQKFSESYDSFNVWTCNTVHLQILPESKKPLEVKEIRNYCTGCGTRIKKSSWKFCPSCGTKI